MADFPTVLSEWLAIRDQIKPLQDREKELRLQLFAAAFPAPREGSNNYRLPNDMVFRGVHKITRKVEPDLIHVVNSMLANGGHNYHVDNFLRTAYTLNTEEYKTAPLEVRAIVDRMLTVKPATPSIDVISKEKA